MHCFPSQGTYDFPQMSNIPQNYENQIIAPNQRLIMEYKGVKLLFVVKTVQLGDLSMSTSGDPETLTLPTARGILTQSSQILLFKDAKSNINLKPSKKRPVTNAILQPNFKFEEMGIGGLDKEFGTIFRRAFASRIFPPGLIQSIGVQHVKGILLFGPPGTGKTLIARQIGKMLNAREPKIINGPEVLNKYVGQSEENIRKLFADAEKEYKEKGEESGLHIIIFDELDAVCKQRGSGAGGGTGVGDSVVNQLLAKLDGVDQLNNILLIGMTNRKDMIDDALMRPGRLEVHMEISLPDEAGRIQILKIHTTKMSESGNMDPDVNILNIAKVTKNFSGAEISGLVRSATSFALNRYVKDGTTAGIRDDVQDLKVNSHDFNNALQEVKSAFGVSEDDLMRCIPNGIIHYSPFIDNILKQGHLRVQQVRDEQGSPLYSALLYGLQDSGKTALAAEIALSSGFPFIQLCSPINMIGLNEPAKVSYIQKIFEDAYKSPLSIVIIDDIERILNWSSVGPRFENNVCQTLLVLLKKTPPEGKRLLILGTSSDRGVLNRLDLFRAFKTRIAVPNVGTIAELAHIMQDSKAFSDPRGALEQLHEITKSDRINVGIKQVLEEIKGAKQNKDINGTFASEMANLVAENKDLESEEESKEESKE